MTLRDSETKNVGVMILAAGLGKRMCSSLPKVLHEIGGKPLIFHVLRQVNVALPHAEIGLVLGHGRKEIEAYLQSEPLAQKLNISIIIQEEQKGTGHAARCAMESDWGQRIIKRKLPVLILPGDSPLISSSLVEQMTASLGKLDALRLLTCEVVDPTGYGRIVRRGKNGPVLRIVEEKDANLREKSIREVAVSMYFFQSGFLQQSLQLLSNKNAQGEYYLTDLIGRATQNKKKIDVLMWKNPEDLKGINDPWELAQASQILNSRIIKGWALKGVKFKDPASVYLDVEVELSQDVFVDTGVILKGTTRVESGAILGPRVSLKDVIVGAKANIKIGTVAEESEIGPECQVGPYAHLRPKSILGNQVKIGNFVELKKTRVGNQTSIAHLSYLGDAEVGSNVNIGCGFVTCNYDGRVIQGQRKHRTIIEDNVFLGSDCQTVAPIRVGKGAFVASGSTITQDVEPDALAIARSRQINKPGYALKLKKGTEESCAES